MSSLRTTRLLTSTRLARLPPYSQCPHALSRPYATKPNPKATAAKLNNVRKKAASRKTDDKLENDSLAARTPLKRPSSDGLGVPSASPSAREPASVKGKASSGDDRAIADVAPAEAERKESRLREARQARQERTRAEEERRRGEREYEEKKGGLKKQYLRLVIGLPIFGVLSWVLWNRCELLLLRGFCSLSW